MKRELDLIRLLLLQVEAHDDPTQPMHPSVHGYTDVQVQHHVKLLTDAGYLEADNVSTFNGRDYRPLALTWKGHDLLDAIRNATIWNRVKTTLRTMGTEAPLNVIQQLAVKYLRELLGLGDD